MKKKQKEYLRHELLDRTSTVGSQVEDVLLAHASMQPGSKAFKLDDRVQIWIHLEAAAHHLHAAYQRIGEIHL